MRNPVIVLAFCFCQFVVAGPATQPAKLPNRMTASLTGPVSLRRQVPVTLTLFSKSEGQRRAFNNYSFMFVLLDETVRPFGVDFRVALKNF